MRVLLLLTLLACEPEQPQPKGVYHFSVNGREVRCYKFYASGNALEDCSDGAKYFNVTNIRREQ